MNPSMSRFIAAAAALIVTAALTGNATSAYAAENAASVAPAAATLTVRFEGITIPLGQIMMSVFDSEAAYDAGGKPVRGAMAKVEGDHATVVLNGLAPGRYAIKSFHDVNGDGNMASNPFGMPIEPYAFSNNAKPQGSAPGWAATVFDVAAGETSISIIIQ